MKLQEYLSSFISVKLKLCKRVLKISWLNGCRISEISLQVHPASTKFVELLIWMNFASQTSSYFTFINCIRLPKSEMRRQVFPESTRDFHVCGYFEIISQLKTVIYSKGGLGLTIKFTAVNSIILKKISMIDYLSRINFKGKCKYYEVTNHFGGSLTSCYRPQRSCGKIMFLHLSVILFTRGGSLSSGSLSRRFSV